MHGADVIAAAMRMRAVRAAGRLAWAGHSLLPAADSVRVSSARGLAGLYADNGHHEDAAAVLAQAAGRAEGAARRELDAARVQAQLDAGIIPADLGDVLGGVLADADSALAKSDMPTCVDRLTDALAIAFHPTRHLLTSPSPLLTTPDEFLAPLRASTAVTALVTARRDVPARPRATDAKRLLVVAMDNADLVRPLVAQYEAGGHEVRFRDLNVLPEVVAATGLRDLVSARLRYGLSGLRIPVPASLAGDVAWADAIFVEWGHRALVWTSLLETNTAIVGRIRKYEAMTPMPMLTAWEEVGRTIFVADTIRQVVTQTAPSIRASTTVVVPDRVDLPDLEQAKKPEAARTIALIGWNKVSKDPDWAFDVLAKLRETDPTWRLLLIGEPTPAGSGSDRYYEALTRRIVKFADAVELTGFTEDLPGTLARVGVILSASRLEGQHDSLVQAVASGCLPVVRDWPDLRGWGGAGAVYPKDWVVPSVDAAVARIQAAGPAPSASPSARSAHAWVAKHYDPERLQRTFDAVVFGADGNRRLRRAQ